TISVLYHRGVVVNTKRSEMYAHSLHDALPIWISKGSHNRIITNIGIQTFPGTAPGQGDVVILNNTGNTSSKVLIRSEERREGKKGGALYNKRGLGNAKWSIWIGQWIVLKPAIKIS